MSKLYLCTNSLTTLLSFFNTILTNGDVGKHGMVTKPDSFSVNDCELKFNNKLLLSKHL